MGWIDDLEQRTAERKWAALQADPAFPRAVAMLQSNPEIQRLAAEIVQRADDALVDVLAACAEMSDEDADEGARALLEDYRLRHPEV